MERWVGKVGIVTGASSGIGKAIADSLVKSGMLVIGLARRVELIQNHADHLKATNAKGKLYARKCDVCIEKDILDAFDWTTKNVGHIHVLVNNAGAYFAGNLTEGVTEEWRKILDTNILGLCIATREACKIMKANDIQGHIININSTSGHGHVYFSALGIYPSTKHAVNNLSQFLRQEMALQNTGIKVTCISPGFVRTDLSSSFEKFETATKFLDEIPALECEDIANATVYVLGLPQRVDVSEIIIRPLNSQKLDISNDY